MTHIVTMTCTDKPLTLIYYIWAFYYAALYFTIKGIISQLIDLFNVHMHFDLRLITIDLSTYKVVIY